MQMQILFWLVLRYQVEVVHRIQISGNQRLVLRMLFLANARCILYVLHPHVEVGIVYIHFIYTSIREYNNFFSVPHSTYTLFCFVYY